MKRTVATGLMSGLGALDAAAVTGSASAKTDSYSSRCGDDYSISRNCDYYWRRWQLRLGRLIATRHGSVR